MENLRVVKGKIKEKDKQNPALVAKQNDEYTKRKIKEKAIDNDNQLVQSEQQLEPEVMKRTVEKFKSDKACDDVYEEQQKLQKAESNNNVHKRKYFQLRLELDLVSMVLFLVAVLTRMYRLDQPQNIVFDELHYGKYISLYMKNTFFFDVHPPLGKQLVAAVAYFTGYDGKFKFDRIGTSYADTVPLLALRLVPALFGSLLIPTTYHLMLELGLSQWTAILAAILLLLDNAMLTQSRFILMETPLLFFALFGILCILKYRKCKIYSLGWFAWLAIGSGSLTCALSVKYVGFYSCCLGAAIVCFDLWRKLGDTTITDWILTRQFIILSMVGLLVPIGIYMGIFYIHLGVLYKAGPHDSIMTSAFQASLEGGLASITKGQPLYISHGSQITLRHTHGRTCWLHSHQHVYPVRYNDKRGSSHQQQVSCYSFKDVNNWWIVKRPDKNDLVVEQPPDVIKHGDFVQIVHGITSRALNSHDVAAPMSPQCQEVSCYIDYNVSMTAQNLWRVEILNRDQYGDTWNTIQSLVRLIHVHSSQALKFSGKQLPDWGFHQHEVVTDRIVIQDDTIWNVEEHRYTKSEDQKERERDLVNAEMIPTAATHLSFWDKFFELHYKMMFSNTDGVQNHMYSSEPLEWPLMARGIAYYVSQTSNAQIHLLGNILIWYSGTFSLLIYFSMLVFYLLRRQRSCYDISEKQWSAFLLTGEVFFLGYLFHYLPYFFVERTLFLHHYLPAFTFKVLLTAALIEHIFHLLQYRWLKYIFLCGIAAWLCSVGFVFKKFTVLSYGMTDLTTDDILKLRWKDSWDFIVHKN